MKAVTEKIRAKNKKAIVIVTSRQQISDTLELYKAGADYVILPKVIGGQKGTDIIKSFKKDKINFREIKKEHLDYLKSLHHLMY